MVIAIIARPDRPAAAGGAGGARGRPPRPVRQQPQADRPGPAQLPRHPRRRSRSAAISTSHRRSDWGVANCLDLAGPDPPPDGAGTTLYNALNFEHGRRQLDQRVRSGGGLHGLDDRPEHLALPLGRPERNGFRPWRSGTRRIPTRSASHPPGMPPIDPATGQPTPVVPVSNYAGSFGDNYAGGPLGTAGLPWETPVGTNPPPGQPRIGYNGYWGTTGDRPAHVRRRQPPRASSTTATGQVVTIASVTDGTSNTIIVGEVLPDQTADTDFWTTTAAPPGRPSRSTGTPTPFPAARPRLHRSVADASAPLGCRYSAAAKGFKSRASRRGQLPVRRRLGQVPQAEHQHGDLLRAWAAATAARSSAPTRMIQAERGVADHDGPATPFPLRSDDE